MSNVLTLAKDDSSQLSDLELFTALENARLRWHGLAMCNTAGRPMEDRLELSKQYRRAENEYLALLTQCRLRGIA